MNTIMKTSEKLAMTPCERQVDDVCTKYQDVAANFSLQLNDEQRDAVLEAALFIEEYRNDTFTIHGLAGTGKTVVLSFLAKMYPDAHVVAPTGKAAIVVAQKTQGPAGTIHALFYKFCGEILDHKTGKLYPIFKNEPKISRNSVVLIDECSMVDETQRNDILKTGATIVAFGDPGQLPPVGREAGFAEYNVLLNKIQRQVEGSAIIRQANRVREGLTVVADGPDFEVINGIEKLNLTELLNADMVLCFRNDTVAKYNRMIREAKGFRGDYAQKGETVLCGRNWKERGIANGGLYIATSDYDPVTRSITVKLDNRDAYISNADWSPRLKRTNTTLTSPMKTEFDFGNCLTVHKSQGSEWDTVILIDEYPTGMAGRKEWLYTGITRAAKKLILVKV